MTEPSEPMAETNRSSAAARPRRFPQWKYVFGLVCAVIAGIVIWQVFFAAYTNRFRLTIEVETPDGVKSGSSVMETSVSETTWGLPEMKKLHAEARAEAVFVDLGGGRFVIATLAFGPSGRDEDKIYGLTRAALAPGQKVSWQDEPKLKGRGVLPRDYIPMLITFDDINDPKTVRQVQPDDFAGTFGPGFRFLRAVVETTNDPITSGIIKRRLPWLVGFRGVLGGQFDTTWIRPERNLPADAFSKGAS